MLLVAEPARFTVTIAAEAASIGIPGCWMINVMAAKGQARKSVRIAEELMSGIPSPSQHPTVNRIERADGAYVSAPC